MRSDRILVILILFCLALSFFLEVKFNLTGMVTKEDEVKCGILDKENGIYTFLGDIESGGDCFYVLANNITIDLNGFNLTGKGDQRGYGININGFNGSSIINGRISGFEIGIWLNNSYMTKLENLTVDSNFDSGIILLNSNNNVINNVKSDSNSYYGLKLEKSNENNVIKCFFDYNFDTGIFILDSLHNVFREIDLNFNSWDGIHLYRCLNNSFFDISSKDNYFGGVSLTASSLNVFDKLKIDSSLRGLYVSADSRANVFSDFSFYNCSSESGCLRISNSEGNVFSRGVINMSKGYGVFIDSIISRSSSHNLFRDIVIENSIGAPVYLRTLGSGSRNRNNVFVNSSYSHEILEDFAGGGENELVRMWNIDFKIPDANLRGISGEVVRVINKDGEVVVLEYSDKNGIVAKKELTQYIASNEGINDFSEYDVYVKNNQGVIVKKSIDVGGNGIEEIFFR